MHPEVECMCVGQRRQPNAFVAFLLACTALCACGCSAGGGTTSGMAAVVEDDVFSETHAFDPLFNVIDVRAELAKRRQHPEQGTHLFWEAEDFVYIGTLVDTEWTRRAPAWPVFHPAAFCMAGPNEVTAFRWSIASATARPAKAGPHRLWIRRVQWRQLPSPIVVRILQDGEVCAETTLGDQIDDLTQYQGRVVWNPIDVTLKASSLTIEIEKPKDDGPAGDRIIDAVYLTSNLDYIPVGRTQLPSADILQQRARTVGRGEKIVVWPAEEPWITFGIHDWPTGGELSTQVTIEACQDEYEPVLVRLTSMVDQPLQLGITAGPLKDSQGRSYPGPEIRVVGFLHSLRYGWQPLPLLRRRAVGLAPYHTAGLWITVNTHGVPAGSYHSAITLSGNGVTKNIDVQLTVHPIRIPRDPDFWTFVWGGPPEAPQGVDTKAAYLKDIAAHGNNCLYHTELALQHRNLVKQLGFVSGFSRGVDWGFTTTRKDYDSETYRKTMADGIARARRVADQLGFDEKHFSMPLMDEPALDDHWFNAHKVAQEISDGVMIWIDPIDVSPEQARRFLPIIDHWMPHEFNLNRPETMRILKSGPGRVSFYNHFTQDSANPAKSWSWFRRMHWRAWEHDLDGCAFYSYFSPYANPWDHRPNKVGMYYVVVYPGTAGAIPSPNWEAWREGREDRDRLAVLEKAIDDARERGHDAAADRAEGVLRWAVDTAVNASSPADYRRANQRVIHAILDLR